MSSLGSKPIGKHLESASILGGKRRVCPSLYPIAAKNKCVLHEEKGALFRGDMVNRHAKLEFNNKKSRVG